MVLIEKESLFGAGFLFSSLKAKDSLNRRVSDRRDEHLPLGNFGLP